MIFNIHNIPFGLFFVSVSTALACFLDFALDATIPKKRKVGSVQKIVLRLLVLVISVCTTLQISVMVGFIGLNK